MADTEINIRDGQQKKKFERRTSKKRMPSPSRQKRRRNFVNLNRQVLLPPPPPADLAAIDQPSAPRGQSREEEDPLRASSETEPQRKRRNKGQQLQVPTTIQVPGPAIDLRPTYRADLARKGYLVKNSLGSGSYSKVKKVLNARKNFEEAAIKIIDRLKAPKDYQEKFLPRELEIWSRLSHPNVVALLNFFEDSLRVYMVLEYADGGDALKYIQKSGALSEDLSRVWMGQIASAVRYMHDQNISHRDLKLENLLIVEGGARIKLCDFGFVKEVASREELSKTFCGSKAYAAPEILRGRSYDPLKGDIWAIGVILYIFVTGKMPFDETRGTKSILEEQMTLKLHWNKNIRVSSHCHNLILSMFTWEFTRRPGIYAVLSHDWFKPADGITSPHQYFSSNLLPRAGVLYNPTANVELVNGN